MAVVHYKFKNSVEYDSLTFDGLAISLRDLKLGILKKKRMRAEDTDLQVINAQTGEVYSSPSLMIPKNTSLIIARIPVGGVKKPEDLTPQTKAKKWAAFRKETQAAISAAETGGFNSDKLKQSSDLVNAQTSEIEKIAEMIKQSTKDFDPANYTYKFPTGVPNPSYICRRCGKGGHFIQNCTNEPLEVSNSPSEYQRMKRPTGIPVDSMMFVDEPLPGTYKTHAGKYAVPKIDVVAYAEGKKERPPFLPELEKKPMLLKKPVPKELKCPLCGDLAKDAVVIPCCGISYCDECIRNKLLETEDHVCPSCDSMDVSPDGLIANQMLRRAVTNFQNETGYVKIAQRANAIKQAQAKAAEAARAAAAATQILQKNVVIVPRGPSVLDYRPPANPATPPAAQPPSAPVPSLSSSQRLSPDQEQTYKPASIEQELPTPTMDEPARLLNHTQQHLISSAAQNILRIEPVQMLVGQVLQPIRRPPTSVPYDPYYKQPITNTAVPPPVMPPYPPPNIYPPPVVPPPFVPPPAVPIVRPPVLVPPVYPAPMLPLPTIPPPPVQLPKPLSETEFLEEKNRLLREELKKKVVIDLNDPLLEFARKLEQRKERLFKSRSRSRSPRPRSRSLSRPRYRSRSRGKRSFSRSLTPRRSSLSPRRSYSPRRYSPRRSRSPRYSPRRYYSPRRSRSLRRSLSPRRYRSFSRSPLRRRSFSRSRSRDRRRSPFRRSYSRSPVGRRSPFRRSLSKGRYTSPPPRRSSPPFRRSPPRRSRSRGRSPAKQTYQRARSPLRYSPKRKHSPLRGSKEKQFSKAKSPKLHKDKPSRKKAVRGKDTKTKDSKAKDTKPKDKAVKEGEPRPIETISNNTKNLVQPITNLAKSGNNLVQPIESIGVNTIKLVQTNEPNKENIPDNLESRGNARSNNIVIVNIVDTTTSSSITTTDDNSEIEDKRPKSDSLNQNQNAVCNKVNVKPVKSATELSKDNKALGDKEKTPASALGDKEKTPASALGDQEKIPAPKTEKDRKSNAKRKSKSRSRSKEKVLPSSRQGKQRKKRSPPKKREKSLSLSPERVKEPLKMPPFSSNRGRFDEGRDRNDAGRDRFEVGSRDRFEGGRGGYGRDWERNNRDQDPYLRARQNVGGGFRGRDFRGRGRGGTDFRSGVGAEYNRGQQPTDFRAQEFRAPQQQQTDFRGQQLQTDFRGQQTDFRGQQQQTDFRGQQQTDFRSQQQPEFRGFPAAPDMTAMANAYNRDYPQRGSPGYPANVSGNFPYPPPRDPREDPNWQGLVHDEDIKKFEQYKRFYDFYNNSNRTYGFPPATVPSTVPTGHTPPQGPPPAPPGTMPVPTPPEQSRRRSLSPRRHRSRSPGRRDKDRRDKERDYRDKRSPERRRDNRSDRDVRTPDRTRNHSPEKTHTTEDSERDVTSPEKKSNVQDEKERKKEKRARKKKEKGDSGEKKKKKRKDKSKTKKEKKGKKLKTTTSSDNEELVKMKSKTAESQNETESEKSDSDAENNVKSKKSRQDSTAQSESSGQESSAKVEPKRDTEKTVKNDVKEEDIKVNDLVLTDRPTVAETEIEEKKPSPEKVISEDVNSEQIKSEQLKSEPVPDLELAPISNQLAPDKGEKRRSIKRGNQDAPETEERTHSKKVKIEANVIEERKVEKMDTSGGISPAGSGGFDDIPHSEDELMLDPPELSKWEKDDDPYDLSPEPTKVKEKWKPGKQTFLPRAVIEKAEHVLAQKVMKPTTVSSSVSVIQPGKKEVKLEARESESAATKREKSPMIEPKRRVFMEPDKKKDERRVQSKQQHNVKITVTGDEKRKVATDIDLRNKLRDKRYESERDHSRDYDRSRNSVRDRDRDRSPMDRKRKDSYKDRRSSRDYDRQDNRGSSTNKGHGSGRSMSRKESVIDDSRFVPDYNDDSYSDDVNSEDSSSENSSEEEVKRKHKHKRNKHKKEKKQKKKKEKKKKKHKGEKEKKVKSSVVQ